MSVFTLIWHGHYWRITGLYSQLFKWRVCSKIENWSFLVPYCEEGKTVQRWCLLSYLWQIFPSPGTLFKTYEHIAVHLFIFVCKFSPAKWNKHLTLHLHIILSNFSSSFTLFLLEYYWKISFSTKNNLEVMLFWQNRLSQWEGENCWNGVLNVNSSPEKKSRSRLWIK